MGHEHVLIDVYVNKRGREYRNLRRHMRQLGFTPEYHVTDKPAMRDVTSVMEHIDHHHQPIRVYVRRGDRSTAWRLQAAYFGYDGHLRKGMRDLRTSLNHPFFRGTSSNS